MDTYDCRWLCLLENMNRKTSRGYNCFQEGRFYSVLCLLFKCLVFMFFFFKDYFLEKLSEYTPY